MDRTSIRIGGAFMLAASLLAGNAWADDKAEKAPMPQTKGMQGMDPKLHDKWDKEGKQDPFKDCTPNAEKAAQQAKHPMPDTKGMKNMDPKLHTVDCPEPVIEKSDKPKHIHRGPGS